MRKQSLNVRGQAFAAEGTGDSVPSAPAPERWTVSLCGCHVPQEPPGTVKLQVGFSSQVPIKNTPAGQTVSEGRKAVSWSMALRAVMSSARTAPTLSSRCPGGVLIDDCT